MPRPARSSSGAPCWSGSIPGTRATAVAQAQADLDVAKAKLTNANQPEAPGRRAVQVPVHHRAGARAGAARLCRRQRRGRPGPGGGGQRADPAGGHRRSRPDQRDHHREAGRAGPGDFLRTSNVSGGTTLMKMADLNLVQVRTLVDETDIGKIQPGQRATVTVDAFPNRPFHGHRAQDRAPGADRAECHHVPGAGPDR